MYLKQTILAIIHGSLLFWITMWTSFQNNVLLFVQTPPTNLCSDFSSISWLGLTWLRSWILINKMSHTSQLQEKATKDHDPGFSKRFKSWSAALVLPHPTFGAKINCYLCKLIKHLPPSSDQTFLASRDSDLLWVIISFHRWLFLLGSRALFKTLTPWISFHRTDWEEARIDFLHLFKEVTLRKMF